MLLKALRHGRSETLTEAVQMLAANPGAKPPAWNDRRRVSDALGPDVLVYDTHNPAERVFELLQQLRDGASSGVQVSTR